MPVDAAEAERDAARRRRIRALLPLSSMSKMSLLRRSDDGRLSSSFDNDDEDDVDGSPSWKGRGTVKRRGVAGCDIVPLCCTEGRWCGRSGVDWTVSRGLNCRCCFVVTVCNGTRPLGVDKRNAYRVCKRASYAGRSAVSLAGSHGTALFMSGTDIYRCFRTIIFAACVSIPSVQ
jgi:hypothetical protein